MAAVVRKILRPYTPANGTEGCWFMTKFCENCIKDHAVNHGGAEPDYDGGCQILARSFSEQQPEWVEMDSGPFCTAYVPDEGQDPNQPTPIELERAGQVRLIP